MKKSFNNHFMQEVLTTQTIKINKFSPELKRKIKEAFISLLKRSGIIIGSLIIICLLLFFRAIRIVGASFESVAEYICLKCGVVDFVSVPEAVESETLPAFTDDEIKLMAKKIGRGDVTLQEISDQFNISQRQARKVKQYIDTALDIRKYPA